MASSPQSQEQLEAAFARLREVVEPFMGACRVKTDDPGSLYLETRASKPEMFSAVSLRKSAVSFHYMPVYVDPGSLEGISEELRRRMQGKSCFNFKRPDDPAIEELEALVGRTAAGFLDAPAG